ncbi:MAG: hypothetical protein KDB14_06125 [Planctomycetales bacterium]|nr:hypothetical protein [Planctomycetales bacterium]
MESILRWIPGFRGYLEKEYRREADYLLRTTMADQLQAAKPSLDEYARGLLNSGHLDALPEIDRIRVNLDKLIGLIRAQVRGYSGFFDYVRVDAGLLDRVYEHDLRMVEQCEALASSIRQLEVKGDTPASVVSDLLRRISEFEQAFKVRGEMLQGVSGGE